MSDRPVRPARTFRLGVFLFNTLLGLMVIPSGTWGEVRNPGFEVPQSSTQPALPADWRRWSTEGVRSTEPFHFHSGSAGLMLRARPTLRQGVEQIWDAYVPGETYRLTFWGKVVSTAGLQATVNLGTLNTGGSYLSSVTQIRFAEPEWTKFTWNQKDHKNNGSTLSYSTGVFDKSGRNEFFQLAAGVREETHENKSEGA